MLKHFGVCLNSAVMLVLLNLLVLFISPFQFQILFHKVSVPTLMWQMWNFILGPSRTMMWMKTKLCIIVETCLKLRPIGKENYLA